MPLDTDVAAFLGQLAEAEGPAMTEVEPAVAREMYRAMQSMNPVVEIASKQDMLAGDIPIRIYRNTHDMTPSLVYFHGGGWVIGDLDTHDCICTQLVDATGYTVIAVDYRLSPEHPFPAPLEDCYAAFTWIHEHAAELKIDPARIAVAGDSAGGNLSAAVALKARDEAGPAICYQLLIYPVTDSAMDTASYEENAEGYLLTREGMAWFWNHYAGNNEASLTHPHAAPIRAQDLSGLPPACVITAEFDPLRDEGEAFAAALAAAGVEAVSRRFDGIVHGFFGMPFERSGEAMEFAAGELRKALG